MFKKYAPILNVLIASALISMPLLASDPNVASGDDAPTKRTLKFLNPDDLHQSLIFSLRAYYPEKANSGAGRESGWSFQSFKGEVGIKGANIFRPVLKYTQNHILTEGALAGLDLSNMELEVTEQSGFVAVKLNKSQNVNSVTVFVAFQGTTATESSIATDMNVLRKTLPAPFEGSAHAGFVTAAMSSYYNVKMAIADQVSAVCGKSFSSLEDIAANKDIQLNIIFSGHSLGAAKAALTAKFVGRDLNLSSACTARIRLYVVSIGGPALFDSATADDMDNFFGSQYVRLVAPLDFVSRSSDISFGYYKHAGIMISLPRIGYINIFLSSFIGSYLGSNRTTPFAITEGLATASSKMHSCENYIAIIINGGIYRKFYFESKNMVDPDAHKYAPESAASCLYPVAICTLLVALTVGRYISKACH
ncbi:MAG: hypothetical protein QS748_08600 [Candidatus Endonucleobacter bathymodioli]|uniref:Fungal lipase-type domain-containing protein n=1 Tax=Candidatus Endonucleibacter bathymodioli TaxID=539814 RepID=A0AA90NTU1_9GAMM|nr:hypothetical protein [Candidatus Endonucleobacter bathymodioli]